MRHRLAGRHLGRTSTHRVALFRNLARAIITHESIKTTTPKAKTLRPFIERLVTLARKAAAANDGSPEGRIKALHYRRQAMAKLGPTHGTGIYDKKGDPVTRPGKNNPVDVTVLEKLFNDLGPRFKDRPGGYTRILKLHQRRLGDAGEQAVIEFVNPTEQRAKKERKAPAAPAPTPAAAPTPEG
jgi:large subunit ribosomal protein L17